MLVNEVVSHRGPLRKRKLSEEKGDEKESLLSLLLSVRPFVIMFSQLYNLLIAESTLAKFP